VDNFVDYLHEKPLSATGKRLFVTLPKNKAATKNHINQRIKNNTLRLQGFQSANLRKSPQGVNDLTRM
jgi:hypothetical protein